MRKIRKIAYPSRYVFFQSRKITRFSKITLQVTKSGSFIFNAKGNGLTRINPCSLPQRQSFMGKGYAVCMVGLLQYNSFWVFKLYQPLNADLYSQQLQRVHEKAIFSKNHEGKILNLNWSVLPHPPYSTNLAPSNIQSFFFFFFFRFLQNALNEKKNIFSGKSGENVCGKLFKLESSWILL